MRPLGELEARVMGVIWSDPGLTVREVSDRLGHERKRAYTTVMTTLDRLHGKGALRRAKDGLAWRYSPVLSPAEYELAVADQLALEILDAHGELGLTAFVDAACTDDALLDRLAELIEERRSAR